VTFDKGQTVKAWRLVQRISDTARLVGWSTRISTVSWWIKPQTGDRML